MEGQSEVTKLRDRIAFIAGPGRVCGLLPHQQSQWNGRCATIRNHRQCSQASPRVKVFASSEDDDLGQRLRVAGALVVAVLFAGSSLLPFLGGAGGGLSEDELRAKLSPVPVFSVTDGEGRPLIAEKQDGSRVGYFFLDPLDAEEYEAEAREKSSSETTKVLPVGLDLALRFVERRDRQVGDDRYILLAKDEERTEAQKLTGEAPKLPLFYAEGLGLNVKNGKGRESQLVPLYFNAEDLARDVQSLREQNQEFSGEVNVVDFETALSEIRAGSNPRLKSVYFTPPADGIAYMKSHQ